jgi:hypothetical protein
MNTYYKRFAEGIVASTALALALGLPGLARAQGVKEVEISNDSPEGGQQIYTVRLRPAQTRAYQKIVFDCVLHQEFPWENTDGGKTNKVHEPAVFTYSRKMAKLTEDLDFFASFRVPVGMQKLLDIYGASTFNTNYPVTVSRMKISGYVKNERVWSFETEAKGLHQLAVAADSAGSAATNQPAAAAP